VDEALEIAARLMSTERIERVRHGIYGETRQADNERFFVVTALAKNSSGEQCGLQVGDLVTAVDDIPVHRSLDFEQALIGRPTGQPIPLHIQRQGQGQTVDLVLAGTGVATDSFADRTWNALGVKLVTLPETEFSRNRSQYRGGMRVTSVRANSPAADQGIRINDVLVGMHIWETISQENVLYVLNHDDLASFQPLKFYILRGGETLYGHLRVSQDESLASRRIRERTR
jgi:serine protease Do